MKNLFDVKYSMLGLLFKLTKYRDVAQLGSALRSGRRGRRFKSCHPDHLLFEFFNLENIPSDV